MVDREPKALNMPFTNGEDEGIVVCLFDEFGDDTLDVKEARVAIVKILTGPNKDKFLTTELFEDDLECITWH